MKLTLHRSLLCTCVAAAAVMTLTVAEQSRALADSFRSLNLTEPYSNAGRSRYWSNKTNAEWLRWGFSTEPERNFAIGVIHKSDPSKFNTGLRNDLRAHSSFKAGKVLPGAEYENLKVHSGMFDALPFVFQDVTLTKSCLAFSNRFNQDRFKVYGWLCATAGRTPTTAELECILASVSVKGFIRPEEPPKWCQPKAKPGQPL
jgi:opacity protein-like surface antigen